MSTLVTKNLQIGADGTASNNFTVYQPVSPDGTLRIGNGNSGTTSAQVVLTSAGNVGIGTSSPSSVISGTATVLQVSNSNLAAITLAQTSAKKFSISSQVSSSLVFYDETANAERMRIDSSGNLLIGTTDLGFNARQLIRFQATGTSTNGLAIWNGGGSGAVFAAFSNSNGAFIGTITQSGTTAVVYNTTSDYRLKTVIGPVANAGQRIDALQPVEYEWKVDGSRTRGFLAHQFQEVYAGSVSGAKDAVDAEGKPVYQSMQASTSEVVADLVAEIQSLRQRLAALESN